MMLPVPIAAYVAAQNRHDAATLAALFAEDAIVHDERADRTGRAAIEAWMREAIERYGMTMQAKAFEPNARGGVLTGEVSGTFPGSPILLRHAFTLDGDKIARLDIAP